MNEKMPIKDAVLKKFGWKVFGEAEPLSGGFMHKMVRLRTDRGDFALKILNPNVMKRADAFENYARAEALERLLEEKKLPILPALTLGGRKMQEADGAYFYVFEYFDAKPLTAEKVTAVHAGKMGRALSQIHAAGRKEGNTEKEEADFDLKALWECAKDAEKQLSKALEEYMPVLQACMKRQKQAKPVSSGVLTVCHNDMDVKNVLWKDNEFRIIDLECLAYANPFSELLETALSWAGYDSLNMDFERLFAFLESYRAAGGVLPGDWENLYDARAGALHWLHYNIRRVLGQEGEAEKKIGWEQTCLTLRQLSYGQEIREKALECLYSV